MYVGYGEVEKQTNLKYKLRRDKEGNVVHVREFLFPGVKKAEPLDAYGWITLMSRVGSLGGIICLVIKAVFP
jgi:hypothetical protein